MKFGQGGAQGVSLKLPPIDPQSPLLQGSSSALPTQPTGKPKAKIVLGGPVWGCAGWKGSLYPATAKPKDFLLHYAKALGAIELNATFYGIPPKERLLKWASQTGSEFRFCPKVSRAVSHGKDIVARQEVFTRYWKEFAVLEQKLGTSFVQLPENYGPQFLPELETLLKLKPQDQKLAIEFRHPDCFEENKIIPEILNVLNKHDTIAVISDTLGKRFSMHQSYLADQCFVRFLGTQNTEEDLFRLNEWAKRIEELAQKGLKEIYFFIHQPDEVYAAQTLAQFSELCSKSRFIEMQKPIELFSQKQADLFC